MRTPQNADLLLRLSELRREDLNDQDESINLEDGKRRLHKEAKKLGWEVARTVVENDIVNGKPKPASAFKRRKVKLPDGRVGWRVIRPKFRETLDRLMSGKSDGLLVLDLDRATRDPRDLEDLIDIVEQYGVPVASVSGSLKLSNDAEITMARVMVAVANKESRDKARRVSWARERQARAGEYGGGRRPFGFCSGPPPIPDGAATGEPCRWHGGRGCRCGITVIAAEAKVVRDCCKRLLDGVSLRELAAELREAQVPTVTGAAWSAETLRDILLRPRNAGLVVYQGEILDGVTAPWKPVVSPDVFYAVRTLLTDSSRRQGPGPAPRWLGSGVYRCGICTPPGVETGQPVTCEVTLGGRAPRYRCKEHNHLARNAAHVDEYVIAHVAYQLTHPHADRLLAPPAPEVDADALRTERTAIRKRLEQIAKDEVLGHRTRAQVREATRAALERIAEIDQSVTANVTTDPLAEVILADDPLAEFDKAPLSSQRVYVDRLVTVTILPSAKKGRGFDPGSVSVVARQPLPDV
ncbi:MAG: recombinase family protein [Natronosporangium sp.]